MSLRHLPARIAHRLRHPHTTVRWRLTLIYGALFLVCGAGLLAITYGLVSHANTLPSPPRGSFIHRAGPIPPPLLRPGGRIVQLPSGVRRRVLKLPPNVRAAFRSSAGKAVVSLVVSDQRISDLHQLEVESAIALAIMAIISGLLGWVVAGRVLRPLRTITAATQEISEANLHRRLALAGPPDELRQLADTIDGLLWRLEGAFEAQRRFVANASHELRTPLTTVRALLEMVLSDPRASTETFRETCRQVLEENQHEERLIDALLALAQGQRGISHAVPVDLTAVARAVIQASEPEATRRGLRVSESLDAATVPGDSRLIERMVSNLLDNAIRHNVAAGTVSMGVTTVNGDAVLHVTNTGPLIPADQVERLVAPFQRLNGERIGRDGLGLGLSIVQAIAAAHQATLDLHPLEHGGLDVQVRFPTARVAEGVA
ncbi:MAG TPA: ATP-binding protein [Solirubrobacteraceae bacterium]|jgi:signal transduction histidine kinase